MTDDIDCPNPPCTAKISYDQDKCPVCDVSVGNPLIRELLSTEEIMSLQSRYDIANAIAKQKNVEREVQALEQEIKDKGKAVINVDECFLADFLKEPRSKLSNYRLMTKAEIRSPADKKDHKQRLVTEAMLFGEEAEHVRYAALSINGQGLSSYGNCSIELKSIGLDKKATLLEENSYFFVTNHNLQADSSIPFGYRSRWQDKHLLAISKLAQKVKPGMSDFVDLVLNCEGNRETDQFIEIHIHGALDVQSFDYLKIPKKNGDLATEMEMALRHIVQAAEQKGIQWQEL